MAETTTIPERPGNADELEKLGIDGLVRELHNNIDPLVRQYSAYLLGNAKNPRAIQPLVESLADFDKSVREQATQSLVLIGKTAIEPLTEALKEPKWETRFRAAEAMGRIADEKAVQPLIKALKDNTDHVRYMAAKGLREIGNSDAIEPMTILLKDENRFVRMMAARALGSLCGKNAHDALEEALKTETDEKVIEAINAGLADKDICHPPHKKSH